MSFKLTQDGIPKSPAIISGHPMLVQVALEDLRALRFEPPKDGFPFEQTYVATYIYSILTDPSQPHPAAQGTSINTTLGSSGFEVDVQVYAGPITENCPSPTQPTVIPTPQDFVELSHFGCYGSCPIYTVRISASGEIDWNGVSYVHTVGKKQSKIDPQQARALIERFRTLEFWSLCGSYSSRISDLDTAQIKLRLGGDGKSVSDYGYAAPSWVRELEAAIGQAAHTEHWIGSPKDPRASSVTCEFSMVSSEAASARCCPSWHQSGIKLLLFAGLPFIMRIEVCSA